jgi:hypothetical protein
MAGHPLNHLLTAETKREHRAMWFVWAGDEKIPYERTMRGAWGYDVACSCGWESHIGGGTRGSVEDALWEHRWSAQCDKERAAEMRAAGLDPDDQRAVIAYLSSKLQETR